MTFTIDADNNISAFATAEEAAAATATPFDSFSSQKELAELAQSWPDERLIAIFNSLPGVTPVKKFKDRKTAISRIWARIQSLDDAAKPEPEPAAKPKAERKTKGGPQLAKGAPPKEKTTKKANRAKGTRTAKRAAKTQETAGPREGSKIVQVVSMLRRSKGATITEIMKAMSWQRHTVRGFMAGAMKKAGYVVESFKPEGGERSYRLPK